MKPVEYGKSVYSSTARLIANNQRAGLALGVACLADLGGHLGKQAGDASSLVVPVHAKFAPGLEGDASPSGSDGTDIALYFGEIHLPKVPSGLRIKPSKLDPDLKSPQAVEKYTSLISQPKAGLGDPIKEKFQARELAGALTGAFLLPVLGAVALRRLQRGKTARKSMEVLKNSELINSDPELARAIDSLDSIHNSPQKKLRRRRLIAALAVGGTAFGTAGAAYGVYDRAIRSEFNDHAISVNLPDRTGVTSGMTIKGKNSEQIAAGLEKIYGAFNRGEAYWDNTNSDFAVKWKRFVASGQYDKLVGPDKIVGLVISGTHCKYTYTNTLLETLMSSIRPKFTVVAGDIYITNGSTPLEKNCYHDLAEKVTSPLITIQGNHDPEKPAPTDLNSRTSLTKTVKGLGFTFVGMQDPRSHAPGKTSNLKGVALSEAFADQGSVLAKKACEVLARTGQRPIVVVHYENAGDIAAEAGCASVVDNAHGDDNIWEPRLRAYDSERGTTYQQTTVTAAGYDGGYDFVSPAKRPGSAIIQVFDKYTHELTGSVAITYGPDEHTTRIQVQKLPLLIKK